MKKTILHLCADTGSDTRYYREDDNYEVILVGSDIGVENYHPPKNVYGIIANPPCTHFSSVRTTPKVPSDEAEGMRLVIECQRIIKEANPTFWAIENPATGRLKKYLGEPRFVYQPWEFGSPWTKKTALWGKFNIPEKQYTSWDDVPKNDKLYIRPGREKPSLIYLHARKHMKYIPEFAPFLEEITSKPARDRVNGGGGDMEFRSLCSQKFAAAFYKENA